MDRNDLISREALKKHIIDIFDEEVKHDKKWAMGLKYSLKIIDKAPTVEYPFYQEAYQTGYEEGYEKAKKELERPKDEWYITPDRQITIEEYMQSLKGEKNERCR